MDASRSSSRREPGRADHCGARQPRPGTHTPSPGSGGRSVFFGRIFDGRNAVATPGDHALLQWIVDHPPYLGFDKEILPTYDRCEWSRSLYTDQNHAKSFLADHFLKDDELSTVARVGSSLALVCPAWNYEARCDEGPSSSMASRRRKPRVTGFKARKEVPMRAIPVLGILTVASALAATHSASGQPPYNPVDGDTGRYVTGSGYDPFSNNYVVGTNREMARASAYDPNRGVVDPGSYRYVNRWVRDETGAMVQEYGYTWTSYGVPHGNLKRVQTTYTPPAQPYYPTGMISQNTTGMVYGPQPQPGQIQQNSTGMVYSPNPTAPGTVQQNTTQMFYSARPQNRGYVPPSTPGVIQQNSTGMQYGRR